MVISPKLPEAVPQFEAILARLGAEARTRAWSTRVPDDYRHWDELKHRAPPEGMNREEWCCALKIRRLAGI